MWRRFFRSLTGSGSTVAGEGAARRTASAVAKAASTLETWRPRSHVPHAGMKCQHPAMTDVSDPTSDPYFYAAESGRVVASFGAEELTWLRAAARGFYRKYVSRTEKNELWPHRPFVLRVDGMDFSDAETVFTTSKEGELNYRRFKRCIAEDVVRKSLDKLAPPRRLNGKSEPWAVPNRVEVRCRAFEHKQAPVYGVTPAAPAAM